MNNQNQTGTVMNTSTFYFIDHMATELVETDENEQECNAWDDYMSEMSGIVIY